MFSFSSFAPKQIDKINLVLIFVSVIIAVFIPFELFLFSYAILGPLHYLTEISWLHHKKYFLTIPERGQKMLFPAFIILLVLFVTIGTARLLNGEDFKYSITNITLYVFCFSLILIVIKRTSLRIGAIALLTLVCIVMNMEKETITCTDWHSGNSITMFTKGQGDELKQLIGDNCQDMNKDNRLDQNIDFTIDYSYPFWVLLFGTYIPTLIHVYVFTFFFMLYGALKNNSLYGKIAVAVLVLAAMFLLFVPLSISYNISDYAFRTYDGLFSKVNKTFMKNFNYGSVAGNIYTSKSGLMLARFIAFAYTYHYLNWFSKTSIIQWHKMPKLNLAIVVVLWLSSIGLYWINFKLGFIALLFLSFLHVYLEFPLNMHSIKGIWLHFFPGKLQADSKPIK